MTPSFFTLPYYLRPFLALSVCLVIASCAKETKSEPDPVPVAEINAPPASGELYVFVRGQHLVWTTDLTTSKALNNNFGNVQIASQAGDTIVFNSGSSIVYGNVRKPAEFKVVTGTQALSNGYIGYINGVIVAWAVDGNNRYKGSCNLNNSESSITYEFVPDGYINSKLYNVGHALLSSISTSSTTNFAFSRNGTNWNVTSGPTATDGFVKLGGLIYAFNQGGSLSYTNDTSFSTAWSSVPLLLNNTTDTSGSFNPTKVLLHGSSWRAYGTVYASAVTGIHYPAVNISTDLGQTWQTSFLTGIPSYTNNTSANYSTFSISSKTLLIDSGLGNRKYYQSTDGISFSEITSGLDMYEALIMSNFQLYFP